MHNALNALVVDDEYELRESLSEALSAMGHNVLEAHDGPEALRVLKERGTDRPDSVHLVLLDMCMPGMSGMDVLREIRAYDPTIAVLIITAHGNIRDAVEAMRHGAHNYIEKPIDRADIQAVIANVQEANALVHQLGLSSPKLTLDNGEEFVGHSERMRSLFQMIQRLGQVNTNVLIRGENGTGKELVARAIHYHSPRKNKPFVAVNCAAIPDTLIESELFGHEKGAFTGADKRQIGKFQFAEGGTLFLDEIGDISAAMQVKLLRVLQERQFTPVGSNREIRSDVRIIAATNRNLEEMIARGEFRQDLFYRLNVVPVELPPLRDRKEEIPSLVVHFVEKFNDYHGRKGGAGEIVGITDDALDLLCRYNWPGNIRELENVIERAFVMEASDRITTDSLPQQISGRATSEAHVAPLRPVALDSSFQVGAIDFQNEKERFEREFIVKALRQFNGRINQTVAHAGIPKNTLLRKMRKYNIQPEDYLASGE